jgi:hypothetical protein
VSEATDNRGELSSDAKSYMRGNVTIYYSSGVYAASKEVPSSYEAGKLEYGYLKVGPSGKEEVVWAGAGDLTLSSELAETAGAGIGSGSLSLIKTLYKAFQGDNSVMGVGAYNTSMSALGTLLDMGTISPEEAREQCEAAKQLLAKVNPSFSSAPCECVLGNLAGNASSCGGGSNASGATAAGLWSGYVMQLSQAEDLSIGSTNTDTIVDELEVFESGPFAPFENGGVVSFTTPCVYFPPTQTMKASVEAMLNALQQAPIDNASAMASYDLPAAGGEAQGKMEQATLIVNFNLTSQEVAFALYAGEATAVCAQSGCYAPAPDLTERRRRLGPRREIPQSAGGYLVPWHRTSKLATANTLTTKHLGSKVFAWTDQGSLTLVPYHTATGSSSASSLNLNQVALRLCAQILGKWTCQTTTMLADPDNGASLSEGAKRLQLPLAVDYYVHIPPMSSIERYELVNAMQKALAAYFGIDDYRLLVRDFTPTSTPLSGLGQDGLDADGIGAYCTFDVLPSASGGVTPESVARVLQTMLDDPTGTSLFYHQAEANTDTLNEAYILFQTFVPVRGATLTELAADGTFSARIPPPSPPPPSVPPLPKPPPPNRPPPPPAAKPPASKVRWSVHVIGNVDTFDKTQQDGFVTGLAGLLGAPYAASDISLEVAAASVLVTVIISTANEAAAAALVVKLNSYDLNTLLVLGAVESKLTAAACKSDCKSENEEALKSWRDGNGDEAIFMGLGIMELGAGAAAVVVILLCCCVLLCYCCKKKKRKEANVV